MGLVTNPPDVDHLLALASRLPLRDQARLAQQLLAGITSEINRMPEALSITHKSSVKL